MTATALNPHKELYVSKWVTFASCALLEVCTCRPQGSCQFSCPVGRQPRGQGSVVAHLACLGRHLFALALDCPVTQLGASPSTASLLHCLQACAGLAYSFSVYAPTIKDSLDLTQTQVATVGSAVNLGGYFAIVSGAIYDSLKDYHKAGPRSATGRGCCSCSWGPGCATGSAQPLGVLRHAEQSWHVAQSVWSGPASCKHSP